jgi:VWFA-related protein
MRRLFAFFLFWAAAFGQPPAPANFQQGSPENVIHINVNLVQLDAVVTDAHGKHVTDLRPEDFEILQDGKPQRITNFSYIQAGPPGQPVPASARADARGKAIPPPPMALKPQDVRRTMALVVDDLGLSFESMAYVRRALKDFVDRQMRPGDLVAVIRTSAGMGALQQFTSDKRLLDAAIDRARYSMLSRVSVSSFGPAGGDESGPSVAQEERNSIFTAGTLGAIRYVVNGLHELPGRKALVLFSENMRLLQGRGRNMQYDPRVMDAMHRLEDAANRASVVIYSIDPRGLQTHQLTAADDTRGMSTREIAEVPMQRSEEEFRSQDGLERLAHDTGGRFYFNSNDIPGLLREAVTDSEGYYLLAYHPDARSFDPRTGQTRFHSVAVRLKVPGLRVRYRHGFYGRSDSLYEPPPRTARAQIEHALFSPFGAGDVRLRLTALFTNAEKIGSYLNAALYINANDLTFTDQPGGWHKAVFEAVAITLGENGETIDSSAKTYTLQIKGESYRRALANGMFYHLEHPVKKPGYYQMRVALRDDASGRVGSASQFIEIPDVRRGLTLSSLILGKEPPAPPPSPEGAPAADQPPPQPDPKANAVLRTFRPGDAMEYAYQVIDVRDDPGKARSFEVRTRLFLDGKQIHESQPMPLETIRQSDPKRLLGGGGLHLGAGMQPGDYVLQVIVTESTDGKQYTAAQAMDFEIESAATAPAPPSGSPKP